MTENAIKPNLRPLDTLNEARDKTVLVELKNGAQFMGKLKAFDIHINTVLEDAKEMKDGKAKRNLGKIFIRGDTIILVSPSQ
jgi:small nuclear ribonucleoprotein (snRNP)-like protein